VRLGQLLLGAASLLLVLLTAFSLTLPAPLWWLLPVGLLVLYQGVIVWGVLDLRLSMFVRSTCRLPTQDRVIALTFDDGPDPISTPLVLDALREAEVKATFFVIGHKVERYPEIIKRIAEEGHLLALHSYQHQLHYSFLAPQVVRADIEHCKQLLANCGVSCSNYFRPPVGQASPRTGLGIHLGQVECIGWSVRGGDGVARRSTGSCVTRVETGLAPGAIVLLHDAWHNVCLDDARKGARSPESDLACSPAGVRGLPQILATMRKLGYRAVRLDEGLALGQGPA